MSFSVELDTSDYDARIAKFQNGLGNMPRRFAEEGSNIILNKMQELVNVKTGNLRHSITRQVNDTSATIGTTAGYGKFVDQGTKPHVILPKNPRGFLRFEIDGNIILARRVNHPGYSGSHFVDRTVEQSYDPIIQMLKKVYVEEIQ